MRTLTTLVILASIGSTANADDPAPAPAPAPATDAPPDAPATAEDPTAAEEPAVIEPQGLKATSVTLGASEDSYVGGSGVAKEWMILPEGQVIGSELRFLTSKPSLGPEPIEFSDVALLTLHIKSSVYGKAEVAASVDVLPKQPSWTDEKVWQGASPQARGQLGPHPVPGSAPPPRAP